MTAQHVPLGGDDAEWVVRVAPEAIADFCDRPDGAQLLEVCIDILGQNPRKPVRGKAGLMRGHEPVRKFRPPGFGELRVYYAIDEVHRDIVWLLGVHPRSKAHRAKDLRAARRRLERTPPDSEGGDERSKGT